jgi:hypothetical protein
MGSTEGIGSKLKFGVLMDTVHLTVHLIRSACNAQGQCRHFAQTKILRSNNQAEYGISVGEICFLEPEAKMVRLGLLMNLEILHTDMKFCLRFLARLNEMDHRTVLGRSLGSLLQQCDLQQSSLPELTASMVKKKCSYMAVPDAESWRIVN